MLAKLDLFQRLMDFGHSLLPLPGRAALEQTLFLIPLFPLIGFMLNGLFGRRMDRKTSAWLSVFAALGSFVWAALCVSALDVHTGASQETRNALHAVYGRWLSSGDFNVSFGLMLDPLAAVMILIVTGIGTLIHIYSVGYMAHDAGLPRFFAFLNLFLFAMILLVLGDNLILLFVGWEGVGLCSYLLIGFWYEDAKNAAAGMKAFVVNRIGDLGFMLGIFTLIVLFGTVNFAAPPQKVGGSEASVTKRTFARPADRNRFVEVPRDAGLLDYADALRLITRGNPAESSLAVGGKAPPSLSNLDLSSTIAARMAPWQGMALTLAITIACMLLFVGAIGKSAQIPLYVWLPDAMAGPTPVSALIHAATMVTAGVYMVCRLHGLFAASEDAMRMVAVIGGATALFSALIGLTQLDIKKVLAYSTVSQLGYMFLGLGVGAFSLGIFHVMTHAFFKALLFLGAGSVIHAMSGEQDLRRMGGLRKKLPVTFWTMLIGALALAGLPGLSGWFSKDAILAAVLARHEEKHAAVFLFLWICGVAGAFCTAFYSFRLIGLAFFGESRASEEVKAHIHESPPVMTLPLIVLAFFSLIGGFVWEEKFTELAAQEVIANTPGSEMPVAGIGVHNAGPAVSAHVHHLNLVATFLVMAAGIALAWFLYIRGRRVPNPEAASRNFLYRLSLNKFYVDEAYEFCIVNVFATGSELVHWLVEMLCIDLLITGSAKGVANFGGWLRRMQTGLINSYAGAILLGALALLVYLLQEYAGKK